jgi:DnaJ family protein C protein 28
MSNDDRKKPLHPALEAIEEAMKRGDFDNLPGKGKPIKIDPKELTDPLAMTNGIRRNANLSTPWEELQREINRGLERAERDLEMAHSQRRAALQRRYVNNAAVEKQWQDSLTTFRARLSELNSRILTFNLMIPRNLPHLHKARLKAEEILPRLGIADD